MPLPTLISQPTGNLGVKVVAAALDKFNYFVRNVHKLINTP